MRNTTLLPALVLAIVLGPACEKREPPPPEPAESPEADPLARADAFYHGLPRYQQPLATAEVPRGIADLSAETCGACHQEIYKEWAISTHRRAWLDDPQFQVELAKSRGDGKKKGDVSWMCINCHTPLTNQMEQLVVGLRDGKLDQPIYVENPTFDRKLQLEAITCASCHVRDGTIRGPRGDDRFAPHPVTRSEELVSEATCNRCHQAEAVFPEIDLGCFFGTGTEFLESPAAKRGDVCQTCHMPEVERKVAEAFDVPVRKTKRHWFGGSLIPKQPAFAAELAPLEAVFGDAVNLRVEPAGAQTGVAEHEVPETPHLGCSDPTECTRLAVIVANDNAGHYFPTGDPERHADIVAEAIDASGIVIARSSIRIASKFQWWPKMEKIWDNRIPAGEQREFLLAVPATDFTVRLRGEKLRMYPDAVKHHKLDDKTVVGRTFHESTWTVRDGKLTPPSD